MGKHHNSQGKRIHRIVAKLPETIYVAHHILALKTTIIIAFIWLASSHAMPAIDQVVIDNGYLLYFQGSVNHREAASLHMFDMLTGKFIKRHLPGSTCENYRKGEVFFPSAWTLGDLQAGFLFPLAHLDDVGRTVFFLWEKDVEDYFYPAVKQLNPDEQEESETFSYNSLMCFIRVTWHNKHLVFMSSFYCVATQLNQDNFHLWYALSGDELLLHVPLSSPDGASNGWLPAENPPFFGWARCVPAEQKDIPFFSVHPNDGTTPAFGVKSLGKEIYVDGEKQLVDNASDWLVQFKRQDGTCFWRSLNADNSWKDIGLKNGGKAPRTVIVNNDSGYVCFSSDLAIDSGDIPKTLSAIADGLRERKLLKDYPPREPSERMKKKLQKVEAGARLKEYIRKLRGQDQERK